MKRVRGATMRAWRMRHESRHCYSLLALLAAFTPIAGHAVYAQGVSLVVDCHAQRLDLAERATCASPGLMQLTSDVDRATKRLESMLRGTDREALIDTERPLRTQRNACANDTDPAACVDRVLRARIAALGAATAEPKSIADEISRYTYLNVAYVRRWGDRLVGKRIDVWGCVVLDPAADDARVLHGVIRNDCSQADEPSVAVLAEHVTSDRAAFYAKHPTAYWSSTLARRDGRLVLSIDQ